MTKTTRIVLALVVANVFGCGLTDRHVESCGTHCPSIAHAGSSGSGQAGLGESGSASPEGGHSGSTGGAGADGEGGAFDSGPGGDSAEAGAGMDGGEVVGDGAAGAGSGGEMGGTAGASGCEACPAEAPHCHGGECVECLDDEQCNSGVCEQNACVACRSHDDCGDPAAARCSQNQCIACLVSGDCDHLAAAPVCASGSCVACNGGSYGLCGTNSSGARRVCDSLQHSCSNQLEHSAGLCEPCVSDAQCKPGQLCVMQTYDDPSDSPDQGELEAGYFCFWREDSAEANAPGGDCASARPYVDTLAGVTSIDGTQATVCGLRVTTCAGYHDYSSQSCTDSNDDSACGDSRFPQDGYCELFSATTYRCTTPCGSDDDCKVGFSCNTSVTPNYCKLQ